jgi:S1-C subfamily serine protease
VRRLGGPPWFRLPEIYITTTSKITPQAIAELQRRVPGLEPITRGGAMLGVSFPSQDPCIVGAVQPGSGAERAGLRQGDIITTYDGVALKNLKHLTDITGTHSPGDKVVLEIIRDSRTLTVEVELTAWK